MKLKGKRVAILATDGFEQSELFSPKEALEKNGAIVDIISDHPGEIRGWKNGNWGKSIAVDKTLENTNETYYNALMLPGGVMNPDKMRMNIKATTFVRSFFRSRKPVAAICHAPQLLIDAEVVENRKLTSWPSLRRDLENAGAKWYDKEVVVDEGLVTSRKPDDLPAFNRKLVEEIYEGKHKDQVVNA
jgi:protease I